jgi:hypothetical protein
MGFLRTMFFGIVGELPLVFRSMLELPYYCVNPIKALVGAKAQGLVKAFTNVPLLSTRQNLPIDPRFLSRGTVLQYFC